MVFEAVFNGRVTISSMPIDHIVALLIAERDRLERAIQALGGSEKRRGRPPKKPVAIAETSQAAPKKRKGFSAATERKMAAAQKARWAKIRAAK
jgi:hypothetical protein